MNGRNHMSNGSFRVDRTSAEVFAAINDVRGFRYQERC
jgi:hypothetical protein